MELDQACFLAWTNWGPEWVDLFFRAVSSHVGTYFLLGLFSFWVFKRMEVQEGVLLVALLVASTVLSDWLSVHAFKDVFQRLRPCHDPDLAGQFTLAATPTAGSSECELSG